MLKQRVITAVVLLLLVLFLIYRANITLLTSVGLLLLLASGWEWLQLIPVERGYYRALFLGLLVLSVGLMFNYLTGCLGVGFFLWVMILLAVYYYPTSETIWGSRVVVAGSALLLLPLAFHSLGAIYLQKEGKDTLLYLLFLVWGTDVGAYLVGKQWGKTKLIPKVSPGKTVEGAMGGFLLAMFVALLASLYFHPNSKLIWYVLATATVFMSILGDLLISMLKRRCQLKDTGQIFPGHGGLLDRLDSVIAAAPIFYSGLMMSKVLA